MAKLFTLIIGLVLTVAGLLILWKYWGAFVTVFLGSLGIILFLAGLLALAIALSELTGRKE